MLNYTERQATLMLACMSSIGEPDACVSWSMLPLSMKLPITLATAPRGKIKLQALVTIYCPICTAVAEQQQQHQSAEQPCWRGNTG